MKKNYYIFLFLVLFLKTQIAKNTESATEVTQLSQNQIQNQEINPTKMLTENLTSKIDKYLQNTNQEFQFNNQDIQIMNQIKDYKKTQEFLDLLYPFLKCWLNKQSNENNFLFSHQNINNLPIKFAFKLIYFEQNKKNIDSLDMEPIFNLIIESSGKKSIDLYCIFRSKKYTPYLISMIHAISYLIQNITIIILPETETFRPENKNLQEVLSLLPNLKKTFWIKMIKNKNIQKSSNKNSVKLPVNL